MKRPTATVIALAALSQLAAAAPPPDTTVVAPLNLGRMTAGYSYYNRPHADTAAHNSDIAACLADGANVRSVRNSLSTDIAGTDTLIAGIVRYLIEDALKDSANRGALSASLENCMVVRGWRVVHLSDEEGLRLSTLPPADLAKTLAPWIGADEPHGTIVREWHNDAALAAVNHFSLHAQHTENGQLSLLAAGSTISSTVKANERADDHAPAPAPVTIKLDPKWPKKPLKPEMLDSAPADAAILLVNIAGVSLRQGNGFVLNRIGPDPATAPSSVDHGPDLIAAVLSTIAGGGAEGKILAFALPPGKWRISGMDNGLIYLNFCLGSPSFEMKAGEVVYAGRLDLKQETLVPDMSLDRAVTWMAGAKAAARMRPAVWTNGSRGKCGPTSIYALEFPGAPFEDGYALGSKVASRGQP